MDFSLTEEQQELRDLAARVLTERVTVQRLDEVEATAERFDRALWQELASTGLLGVAVPEEAGGLGFGVVELALVCEQIGRAVAPVPYVWTAAAALTIAAAGDESQRTRWLAAAAAGEAVLTVALPQCVIEAGVEGDRMTATLAGVPSAHVADAVLVPVGNRVYLLDPTADGVTARHGESTSREICGELTVTGVPVERLGAEDTAQLLWERVAVGLCAVQAGVTDAAVRLAAAYTSERLQFDKPLSTFQGVAHKAADGYIDSANIRATMLQAAWRLGRGDDATVDVLTAAWWAAEAGQRCVHAMQHIHGGIGADITYPSHRYFLWGKQIELLLGAAPSTLARLDRALATADNPGDELVLAGGRSGGGRLGGGGAGGV